MVDEHGEQEMEMQMEQEQTCNCFGEIGKTLERIALSEKARSLKWVIHNGTLEFTAEIPSISLMVSAEKVCNLSEAIKEIADKVDPPKPKEREWRVGDELQSIDTGNRIVIVSVSESGCPRVQYLGRDYKESWGMYPTTSWRNLSIIAEKGAEK